MQVVFTILRRSRIKTTTPASKKVTPSTNRLQRISSPPLTHFHPSHTLKGGMQE